MARYPAPPSVRAAVTPSDRERDTDRRGVMAVMAVTITVTTLTASALRTPAVPLGDGLARLLLAALVVLGTIAVLSLRRDR